MNDSEKLAERYLRSLGLGTPMFEPDGNIPPDFVLNGDIAIEVRRLNQHFKSDDGSVEGLEQLAAPTWFRIEKLLPSLGRSVNGVSWFAVLEFRRPLPPWKVIEREIRSKLSAFMLKPAKSLATLSILENFSISLVPSSSDLGSFFVLGGSCDIDRGGWLMSELVTNLRFCIAEKEKKIAPYRSKYREWWLILADQIDFGLGDHDRTIFKEEISPTLNHTFDKVILLDPRDPLRSFEV